MPTYDYLCDECGHEFELFQQMTDSVKRKCPECGTLRLRRLVGTGAGVIFKGSGFYETDYRSDAYKKAAEAEKKPADGEKKTGKETGKEAGKKASSGDTKAGGGDKKAKKPTGDGKPGKA